MERHGLTLAAWASLNSVNYGTAYDALFNRRNGAKTAEARQRILEDCGL